jgi:hypothetical protein
MSKKMQIRKAYELVEEIETNVTGLAGQDEEKRELVKGALITGWLLGACRADVYAVSNGARYTRAYRNDWTDEAVVMSWLQAEVC